MQNLEEIQAQARQAAAELLAAAELAPGSILVTGCSSSEITGGRIGKASSVETAPAVFQGIYPLLLEVGQKEQKKSRCKQNQQISHHRNSAPGPGVLSLMLKAGRGPPLGLLLCQRWAPPFPGAWPVRFTCSRSSSRALRSLSS